MIDSESSLTTSVIIQRIIRNREAYAKRNKAKEEKELRIIEAKERRES